MPREAWHHDGQRNTHHFERGRNPVQKSSQVAESSRKQRKRLEKSGYIEKSDLIHVKNINFFSNSKNYEEKHSKTTFFSPNFNSSSKKQHFAQKKWVLAQKVNKTNCTCPAKNFFPPLTNWKPFSLSSRNFSDARRHAKNHAKKSRILFKTQKISPRKVGFKLFFLPLSPANLIVP